MSLTKQHGDIHHYAWRAQGLNETLFTHPTLGRLFSNWTFAECQDQARGGCGRQAVRRSTLSDYDQSCPSSLQDCVESLTHVDVRVDVAALRALVAGRLALIRGGASVAEAALPWPAVTGVAAAGQPPPQQQQPPAGKPRLFEAQGVELLPTQEQVWVPVLRFKEELRLSIQRRGQ